LEDWRATLDRLDTWEVETPASAFAPSWTDRAAPLLRVAAMGVLFLGLGFLAGKQMGSSPAPLALTTSPPPMNASQETANVEALVTQQVDATLAQWREQQAEIERKLILASGAMTHRQVQTYVGEALEKLESNGPRNEALALFLPPEEQVAYQEKKAALKSVATQVSRETERTARFTQQIIERARARSLQTH
jgi:hypothetical protein